MVIKPENSPAGTVEREDIARGGRRPVVSIYQNPDHVAGLVQQIFNAPLVTSLTVETANTDENSESTEVEGSGAASIKIPLPVSLPIGAGAKLDGSVSHMGATAITTNSHQSQSFVYSQAYYPDLVRTQLRERSLLTELDSPEAVEVLKVGDFVEFQAAFTAPSIPSIMDVLTPELVGAITEFTIQRSGRDEIDFSDFESIKGAAAELEMKATSARDLAQNVTRALQADFRQEHTREYYGSIKGLEGITAVTICDTNRFLVDDADRVLDGSFIVLGKSTALPREDMPVLERNKLLSNIAPSAVDKLLGQVKETIEQSTARLPFGKAQVDDLMNVHLESRVPGRAFRVLPVAIFV